MLTVGMIRKAIVHLSGECEVRLDFDTPYDAIAEVIDHIELIGARRCPHMDELVIQCQDTSADDDLADDDLDHAED